MAEIIIIIICLGLNAILAAYEMAFVSFSKSELLKNARLGSKSAESILKRRENPERTLSVIQIGITLVGALAAAMGGAGASEVLEPYLIGLGMNPIVAEVLAILIVVLPLTYLSVVFGELVPKTFALRNASKIVLKGNRALVIIDRFLSPAISFLDWSTKVFVRILFPASKKPMVSAEALVEIGELSSVHQQYVLNLAGIENIKIEDMMVKWDEVDLILRSASMDEIASLIFESGHTRLPVMDDEKVIGILHTKEFLAFRESGADNWLSIIRPAVQVRGNKSALGALKLMHTRKSHMVIVYSYKNALEGILTLEDILEEIVGDIFDEDDDGRMQ